MAEIADRISRAIGKTVRYVAVSPAARRQALIAHGRRPEPLPSQADEERAINRWDFFEPCRLCSIPHQDPYGHSLAHEFVRYEIVEGDTATCGHFLKEPDEPVAPVRRIIAISP
jgi:hypothetical protein